jgi:hypothetical protein
VRPYRLRVAGHPGGQLDGGRLLREPGQGARPARELLERRIRVPNGVKLAILLRASTGTLR